MVTPLKTLMGFSVHLNVQLKFYNLPLLYLLIQHSMSVSEISTKLNWEQSGVSHQLQLLRKYNLVQQRREEKTVIYHLEDPQVMTMIADVLSHAEKII